MKKTTSLPLFFLILFVLFILALQSCKTIVPTREEVSIESIVKRINTIKTYHIHLTAKTFSPSPSGSATDNSNPGHFVETKSVVYGESGRKMKIITVMTPSVSAIEMEHMLLFDGTWLWIQQKIIKHPDMKIDQPMVTAMKIHIPSVSPDPINEPFNTIYSVTGIGLFRYMDLPGTLSDLIANYTYLKEIPSNEPKALVFNSTKRVRPMNDGEKRIGKALKAHQDVSTRTSKLWVDKETALIKAYAMGISEKRQAIHTQIEYISINEKLPDGTFIYLPIKGVVVKDATASLLKKKMRKK